MKSRIHSKKRIRKIFEDARSLAGYGQKQQQNNNQQQTDTNNQTVNGEAEQQPAFTAQDVAKLTPGEVINYVYVNVPQNIDAATKQALLARADQLRKDADAGKDVEERAKQILRSVGATIDLS